jgi:hypothetical protein
MAIVLDSSQNILDIEINDFLPWRLMFTMIDTYLA